MTTHTMPINVDITEVMRPDEFVSYPLDYHWRTPDELQAGGAFASAAAGDLVDLSIVVQPNDYELSTRLRRAVVAFGTRTDSGGSVLSRDPGLDIVNRSPSPSVVILRRGVEFVASGDSTPLAGSSGGTWRPSAGLWTSSVGGSLFVDESGFLRLPTSAPIVTVSVYLLMESRPDVAAMGARQDAGLAALRAERVAVEAARAANAGRWQ